MPIVKPRQDDGFTLVALIVAIFLILLALSVAAPRMAMQLKHEREMETQHRAQQYTRAIQLYYRKLSSYPPSLDALEKSNNQRFLRKRYADPMTGEPNWRLIHVGENKTTVKGFFGKDLPGISPGMGAASGMTGAGANLGSATGSASGSTSAFGGSSGGSSGFGGSSSFGSSSTGASSTATTGTGASGASTSGTTGSTSTGSTSSGFGSSSNGISSQSATDAKGLGGPIMGIGTVHSGTAMLIVNEQTTYQDWEFLYDPRIEALKAQVSLFGGGGPPTGGGSSNTMGGSTPGTNGFGTNPGTNGFGTSTPGFGSGSSTSGFGSSTPTTGSSGSITTPPTGTTPPATTTPQP